MGLNEYANPDNETLRMVVKMLVDWAGDHPTASGWLGQFNYNGFDVRCAYDNADGTISIMRTPLTPIKENQDD